MLTTARPCGPASNAKGRAILTPLSQLAEQLHRSRQVLVFTGAGVSTGSGIPDFRGPSGLWTKWKPVYYQDFMTSHTARVRHWEFKLQAWQGFRNAQPNAAHQALSELDRIGFLQGLVTQNIDGLHQLAGHPEGRVIELHGSNRQVECQSCKALTAPDSVYAEFERSRQPPLCTCGGYLKPATVSFGQSMPEDKMAEAVEAARRSELVIAIGSTLEVEPAASIPRLARQNGAFYAILNRGPTAQDELASLRLEGDATQLLPQLVTQLREILAHG